jgi:hypothetical protein
MILRHELEDNIKMDFIETCREDTASGKGPFESAWFVSAVEDM